MPKCELEVRGGSAIEPLLREVFVALSGRHVPTEPTRKVDIAYDRETSEYRTAEGDGLDVSEILDYGEWHHTGFFTLAVREVLAVSVHEHREPAIVFYISGNADAIETFVRLATAAGFTIVQRRDEP